MLPRGNLLCPKPGGGFSEEHDLRPYRRGDSPKSVHWKLSAKRDSLIVREPMVYPPQSRLVQIARWNGSVERDLILGRLRWVSDWLIKRNTAHFVRLGSDGPFGEIIHAGDLTAYLLYALDAVGADKTAPAALPARFTWIFKINARETGL